LDGAGRPPIEAEKQASRVVEVYLCAVDPTRDRFRFLDQILALRAFPCVVGRHRECDHQLDCHFISRRHCAFSMQGGRVWVEDLGSRHGTHLNGHRVEGLRPLQDGDRLDLACLSFQVRLSERSGQTRR
jgi:pSer/pThr/pTyr-binding forkhead associated (FHA) protein